MDIRSKSTNEAGHDDVKHTRPFVAWLCFFVGLILVGSCLLSTVALTLVSDEGLDALKAPFVDYRDTRVFKERTRYYFSLLFSLAEDRSSETADEERVAEFDEEFVTQMLEGEGENLLYGIVGEGDGLWETNIDGGLSSLIGPDNMPVLPEGYGYCWYFDGQRVWVFNDGSPVDTDRVDMGYRGLIASFAGSAGEKEEMGGVRALLAVKDVLVDNPYGYSRYYQEQRILTIAGRAAVGVLAVGVALLICGIVKRRERHIFESKMASWSGKLWLEVKLLISHLVFLGPMELLYELSGIVESLPYAVFAGVAALTIFLWIYMMLVDLRYNRMRFFTHNSVSSLLAWYHRFESRYPWQKRMLKRVYALLGAEAVLVLLSLLFAGSAEGDLAFPAVVLFAGLGLYLIYRYLRGYEQTITDWGRLTDHIRKVKNGDTETKLHVAQDSDIFPAVQDLNSIQEGIGLAVSDKVKSERMKVELITNVSHDLKTPLTSMISYVELLSKEEGLPERVNEYVRILAQKTERLKNLIQDLFELSKATSNDIALDMERIDLVRLIRQVLADMEEPIDASGLVFRVSLPDEPVYTVSDGGKLYRVLQNLISNALKYSLQGSRVFIDLVKSKHEATIVIKNTANYEMDFGEDEVLQRFTRGDRSRSTEGSGLGLSIAKSFSEACGGRFGIAIDGDQFKVQVAFSID